MSPWSSLWTSLITCPSSSLISEQRVADLRQETNPVSVNEAFQYVVAATAYAFARCFLVIQELPFKKKLKYLTCCLGGRYQKMLVSILTTPFLLLLIR